MQKTSLDNKGFGVFDVLVVILVLAAAGAGTYVYHHNHKAKTVASMSSSTSKKVSTSTGSTTTKIDPYAGWKTYTLTNEKIAFKYPSNWTTSNTTAPTVTQDHVTLTASDGFTFNVIDGVSNGGDQISLASNSSIPATFIGQSDHLVFTYGTGSVGQGSSDGLISGAVVLTDSSDQSSLLLDKYAVGPNDTTGAIDAKYMRISASTKAPLTLVQAQSNSVYETAVLVIESMAY